MAPQKGDSMSSSIFGWMAISTLVLALYLPSEGRGSATSGAELSSRHGMAYDETKGGDDSGSDDSGGDSGKDDGDD